MILIRHQVSANRLMRRLVQGLCIVFGTVCASAVTAQAIPGVSNDQLPSGGGVVRLQQPQPGQQTNNKARSERSKGRSSSQRSDGSSVDGDADLLGSRPLYRPSEFELLVRQLAGVARNSTGERIEEEDQLIRRFGAELVTKKHDDRESEDPNEGPNLVPDDYVLGPGDEVLLNLWGSLEATLRLTVDRSGRLAIPRIGTVSLVGVRFGDLRHVIRQRVATQFRNFDLSVALGEVRAIRVYVTGFVQQPGAQSISGLSTVLHALMAAGGPTAVGSYRVIQVRRGGAVISTLDLYDLLLKGDRSADRSLRNDDVVHVAAVGPQIGVIGSVNHPAVFELKAGETLGDALSMAGGLSTVANRNSAVIHRLDERAGQAVRDVNLAKDATQPLNNGDVLRVLSMADVARPALRQSKRVRVDGEVQRPGDYVLPAGSTLRDALSAAGGLTSEAFLFGVEFNRETVRLRQIENYDRALRDLEAEFNRAALAQKEKSAPSNVDFTAARNTGQFKLIERLRAVQPTGRVVLQFSQSDTTIPELALEDGDRLYVPARPSTVNVYGSVFNSGSYLFSRDRTLDQYLSLAGGLTRTADKTSVFVLRANGTVISNRGTRSGWGFGGGLVESMQALPGDTVFVPEEIYRTEFAQDLKDWAQILYQFGLGAVALQNLK
ncbi:SLBB domain-containing protein [Paucibacter sp. PLA-PC-4]|uniref:SLBB domain-containing protein n=1 Tax=Paucibacter sp. PLA-PC-4 TaxID=2993655 RepID=UPI00224AC4DB|nr:SLBB domain-containing protein [Paucibacter sp. PLA-PC-4]MCX2865142.1 SLBB domain-containing protein [Paucibacter sp. PLA-PC-4]